MITQLPQNVVTRFSAARTTFEHDNIALISLSWTTQLKQVDGKDALNNAEIAVEYVQKEGALYLRRTYADYASATRDFMDIKLYAENHDTEQLTTYLLTDKNFK